MIVDHVLVEKVIINWGKGFSSVYQTCSVSYKIFFFKRFV